MRARILLLVVLLATLPARFARADDRAIAEAEFVKAKRLMKEGKTAKACEAFERSQALDPQNGTRYNLAICYVDLGKTASAFIIFRELAHADTNAARKADSTKRAEKLEPKLIKLLVTSRQATPGLLVERDGVDVTRLMGLEEPIDPGRYKIVASAEGYQTWEQEVEVTAGQGGVITVEIPALERPGEEGPDEGPIEEVPPIEEEPRPERPRGSPGSKRRIAGLGIGGTGVVALGIGLYFGAQASSTWGEVRDLCGEDLDCETTSDYARAQELVEQARTAGNVSTVMVGLGAVAILGGVYLYVTAPSGVQVAPQVDGDAVGFVARGAF